MIPLSGSWIPFATSVVGRRLYSPEPPGRPSTQSQVPQPLRPVSAQLRQTEDGTAALIVRGTPRQGGEVNQP